ncbi:C40 family peptidase [Phycicoccus endophyticus]|uniref:C40 family peptidase n=1 Tax=Phycicoccus endophyticus TaxID=1690220 RepID=A0A7G9R280_9MICO|nr:NlpC/P60 family protein [Phycicoccus endophyticus]NHI19640.1 NlpC/P60 family protein [Phycicoccus endophyticus]QNN49705.1 C40 family peptidase [Phycicoccus endophyticus]GGL34298.1 hypothetical protein GCM10012283_15880 [Phycicoccus endophyticus]
MSEHTRAGRHRHGARYNPVAELSSIVRTAGETGARVSAVLAASGGLVATFALPAQAAVRSSASPTTSAASAAPSAGHRAFSAAPAVVAPEAAAPVSAAPAVGVSGVEAVAKPEPEPEPVVQAVAERTVTTASRSTELEAPATETTTEAPAVETPAPVAPSASGVVNIARQYIGIAYSYGGTSPSTGFDCSGFTQYVFGQAGVSLPRTASEQQAAATPVSSPQPGDLVFFGSPAWHVGIYVGNGMMIDSPRPGKSVQERAIFSGVSGYGRF